MNNIACLGNNCTASCAGFFKVLNERWAGKPFAFFFFPFRFLLCLTLLDNSAEIPRELSRATTDEAGKLDVDNENLVTFLGADI